MMSVKGAAFVEKPGVRWFMMYPPKLTLISVEGVRFISKLVRIL